MWPYAIQDRRSPGAWYAPGQSNSQLWSASAQGNVYETLDPDNQATGSRERLWPVPVVPASPGLGQLQPWNPGGGNAGSSLGTSMTLFRPQYFFPSNPIDSYTTFGDRTGSLPRAEESVTTVRRRWCWALFSVLVVVTMTAVALGLYFGLPVNTKPKTSDIRGSLRLKDWTFVEELNDPSSPLFKSSSNYICQELSRPILSSAVAAYFYSCDVLEFRPGSVVAEFRMAVTSLEVSEALAKSIREAQEDGTIFAKNDLAALAFTPIVDLCPGQPPCEYFCATEDFKRACKCPPGLQLGRGGVKCTDIDECRLPGSCDPMTSLCVNSIGSYTCQCLPGFVKQDGKCVDNNECLGDHGCNVTTSSCVNTAGSFSCECNGGYVMENNMCLDIDDCIAGHDCNTSTSECVNTPGDYSCECMGGYERGDTDKDCVDADECAAAPCDLESTTCEDALGSYSCSCKEGFRRQSDTACEDIDECSESPEVCDSATSTCSNSAGAYECQCNTGFTKGQDGVTCVVACGVLTAPGLSPDGASPFIVGGVPVDVAGQRPWVGGLFLNGTLRCGAAVVGDHQILTAAHCISEASSPSDYSFSGGSLSLSQPSPQRQSAQVSQVLLHPDFDPDAFDFEADVAVLTLAEALVLGDYVRPICLPEDAAAAMGSCSVAGWGGTEEPQPDEQLSEQLQSSRMRMLSTDRCNAHYSSSIGGEQAAPVNGDTMICAGYIDDGGDPPPDPSHQHSVCFRDLGSPLECRGEDGKVTALGVASWSVGCYSFSVFTRLTQYFEWLKANIDQP